MSLQLLEKLRLLACAQEVVLIDCTKLKLCIIDKIKAGERNQNLDLTAKDFRVEVQSALKS